jgi:LysR family glycine cleavage system transcriptional activator
MYLLTMNRRLPPLNGVRAFEAAGRHLSFTRAAEELNVTQSAVSHQIKALEERLGVPLFRRMNRALLLTDAGQIYFPVVRDALDLLAAATDRLRAYDASDALTVSVLPSFAARWLVPRLKRFRAIHPEIDVRLQASENRTDFIRENVDVGLRYGTGNYPGLTVVKILHEDVFPVCSPALLDEEHPLKTPSDLRFHTLLHDMMDATCPEWSDWLKAAGVEGFDATRGPLFSDSSMLIQAAVDGQGVALGRSALAADDLAAGRLVKPFDLSFAPDRAYYLVCPPANADRPNVVAFRDWLLEEAARENDTPQVIISPTASH